MARVGLYGALLLLAGCGRYQDFTLPLQPGGAARVHIEWRPRPEAVLSPGAPGAWDSVDVLNPSVAHAPEGYVNLYSGFDGKTWRTGLATSNDGLTWRKQGTVLSPDPTTWEGDYIAANGSAVLSAGALWYFYQAGRPPRIGLTRQGRKEPAPVLDAGPRGSWDERGVADPYVIEASGRLYMFYLGMDRAQRQRLGVAVSDDGLTWSKLRSNPILELGDPGTFDENGLGEPAVWAAHGFYWMLYTGRDRSEVRRLGLAQSHDGMHWEKRPEVFAGAEPWDSKVICDATVLIEYNETRVWFGGGDIARPDENIHGRIGYAVLKIE